MEKDREAIPQVSFPSPVYLQWQQDPSFQTLILSMREDLHLLQEDF